MSDQPLISIVVPIYNAEKFLPKCVDSLLAQTYRNLEIVLVDDGSPDACPAICDAYALRDARVRVLHTENGGLSVARNRGVAAMTGDFVCFVDADDYIDAEMIACLHHMAYENNVSLCVCGTRFIDEAGAQLSRSPAPVRTVLNAADALSEMLYQRLFYNSAWGKLLRADLARALPFPPHQWYEDLSTTYRWIEQAGRVAVDTRPLYSYVQHAKSFMAQAFTPERFALLSASDQVYNDIGARVPAALPAARARRFAAYCQVLLAMPRDNSQYPAERARVLSVLALDAPRVARDSHCRKKDRAAAFAFRLGGERLLRWLWAAAPQARA